MPNVAKSFSYNAYLIKHKKRHTEKKFVCDVCKKKFKYKLTIGVYIMSIHTKVLSVINLLLENNIQKVTFYNMKVK